MQDRLKQRTSIVGNEVDALKSLPVYIIICTAVDADRGLFPEPEIRGCYLRLSEAQEEMKRLAEEEKAELDGRYDCEEQDDTHWTMFQDGYAAGLFFRIEILTSVLHTERKYFDAHFGCGASAKADCERG